MKEKEIIEKDHPIEEENDSIVEEHLIEEEHPIEEKDIIQDYKIIKCNQGVN